jgi:hypothetical protein
MAISAAAGAGERDRPALQFAAERPLSCRHRNMRGGFGR